MNRRQFVKTGASLAGLGVIGTMPVAGQGPEESGGPPDGTKKRGNWIRGRADKIEVTDIVERTADPSARNFDEAFTYWRVRFEPQTYETRVYREPARFGGKNVVRESDEKTTGRALYGVSPRDRNGIQHEIVHKGPVIQYFETADGWTELTAKFANGDLLEVNGVRPNRTPGR